MESVAIILVTAAPCICSVKKAHAASPRGNLLGEWGGVIVLGAHSHRMSPVGLWGEEVPPKADNMHSLRNSKC